MNCIMQDYYNPGDECEEPDSNRRTPAGMDPKSIAFDLARRSSHDCCVFKQGFA